MMKKRYIFSAFFLIISGLIYAAFYEDDKWYPKEGRLFSEPNYLADPDIKEMIEKQLNDVDYAAIVYKKASKVTPNSWFHRVIMGNPYDSTHYEIKADVDFTILGNEYRTITYSSAGRGDLSSEKLEPAYATLVQLCGDSPDNMYAPENGFEFAASKELVEYFKKKGKLTVTSKNSDICPK